jgi:hypothetical protein
MYSFRWVGVNDNLLCVWCAFPSCALVETHARTMLLEAAGKNLLVNSNFSTPAASGSGAASWSCNPLVWSRVAAGALPGAAAAMRFSNDDASLYSTCTQLVAPSIFVKEGTYSLSAWARPVNLTGDDSGATVCAEYFDSDSKYLGGTYPAGFKGTSGWQQIKQLFGVPREAASLQVSVYVRKSMVGTAFFDDVRLVAQPVPPMRALLLAPAYRGQVDAAGPPHIQLRLQSASSVPFASTLRYVGRLVALATGHVTETLAGSLPSSGQSALLMLKTPPPSLLPGRYALLLDVVNLTRSPPVVQSLRFNITRLDDGAPQPTVAVDAQRRLMVRGKPYFPTGMYTSDLNESDFARFGSSRALRVVMPYHQLNETQMGWAAKHSVQVAYSIKDDFCVPPGSSGHPAFLRCNSSAEEEAIVRTRVRQYRNHSALLLWYTNDELGPTWRDRLLNHQRWVEEDDPNHPTWSVIYQVGEAAQFLEGTCDIQGSDEYPVPDGRLGQVKEYVRDLESASGGSKPVMQAIQAFNWENDGRPTGRTPNFDELRSMTWLAICAGANGIFFYSYFELQRNPDVPFETMWSRLDAVADEVQAFAPELLSDGGAAPRVGFAGGKAPSWLSTRERWPDCDSVRGDRSYIVFAVGDGSGSGNVTFALNATTVGRAKAVTVANEKPPRTIEVEEGGGAWTDGIPPLGVRVYVVQLVRSEVRRAAQK